MNSDKFKFQKPGEVRTRFAPSPTGYLHIGSARTCLFNYLFAKKNEGVFLLRIEDTDIERSSREYEEDILESLKWLGIEWDEEPYRQSERLNIYAEYLKKLLVGDKAYYCFCSEEELETQRQYQLSIGEAPRYSGKCANLSKEEAQRSLSQGKKAVVRFRVPTKKVEFNDLIRGKLEFDVSLMGDIVIARPAPPLTSYTDKPSKALMLPLYNFACLVDDFEMKITHVIRGEEHISNTPKQILLQEALNFPSLHYAHLPMILAPDRTKLSKRHGAVGISEYKKEGYLSEAIVNFIAFLGWNPGGEREIYSMPSLIKEFSLERVQKGGAIFNIKRLDFLNGFYIRRSSIEKLTELCLPYLIEAGLIEKEEGTEFKIKTTGEKIPLDWLRKIVSIYQERLKKLSEITELTEFFFKDKLEYGKDLLRWPRPGVLTQGREMTDEEIKITFDKLGEILSKIEIGNFNKEHLERKLLPEAEEFGKKFVRKEIETEQIRQPGERGYLLWPLRVALTGKEASAGPLEIAEILGKEKTLRRIKEARKKL